jgi:hypothetical protein
MKEADVEEERERGRRIRMLLSFLVLCAGALTVRLVTEEPA